MKINFHGWLKTASIAQITVHFIVLWKYSNKCCTRAAAYNSPCNSPVMTLDSIIATVGEMRNSGRKGTNGMARVHRDQPTAALPSTNSPPNLSLSHPPTICVAV